MGGAGSSPNASQTLHRRDGFISTEAHLSRNAVTVLPKVNLRIPWIGETQVTESTLEGRH